MVRRQRIAVFKPKNPAQARKWLRSLSKQIKAHLAEYAVHETFADARYLRWFVDAAKSYNSKKSLDQLLGLKHGPGRPKAQGPGKQFDLAYKIFLLRSTKSPTRRSAKGELKPMMWKEIAKACGGMSVSTLKKIYERERFNVAEAFAKKFIARRKRYVR
jgi:hypothetical protein